MGGSGAPPKLAKAWPDFFFFQAEDGIRHYRVTGVQPCALPICLLADLRLGAGLSRALRAFATGPDEARIAALVATSARFGSPLAHLLVLQADALRETERHRAEAKARRMPILMLFPLALCILPALLLVFLGPPLLSLLR